MKSEKNLISDYIEGSIQTKKEILKTRVEVIAQIAEEIIDAYKRGNKVLWTIQIMASGLGNFVKDL